MEERSGQRTVFRIVRSSKDGGYKNIDFEAPSGEASERERALHVYIHVQSRPCKQCIYAIYRTPIIWTPLRQGMASKIFLELLIFFSAEEIVEKMRLILEGLNTTAKAEYRSRKGSKN